MLLHATRVAAHFCRKCRYFKQIHFGNLKYKALFMSFSSRSRTSRETLRRSVSMDMHCTASLQADNKLATSNSTSYTWYQVPSFSSYSTTVAIMSQSSPPDLKTNSCRRNKSNISTKLPYQNIIMNHLRSCIIRYTLFSNLTIS